MAKVSVADKAVEKLSKAEAAAAVPTRLVEQIALIGPADKIRHDLEAWRESLVTTLLVGGDPATITTRSPSLARPLASRVRSTGWP